MPLDAPVVVVALFESGEGALQVVETVEALEPEKLLLEGADEPLRHTIGLGLADKGKARRPAEEGDPVLDVVGRAKASWSALQPRPRDSGLGQRSEAYVSVPASDRFDQSRSRGPNVHRPEQVSVRRTHVDAPRVERLDRRAVADGHDRGARQALA